MATGGYDCVVIPGAAKGTMCEDFNANGLNGNRFCGNERGLATQNPAAADTMTGALINI